MQRQEDHSDSNEGRDRRAGFGPMQRTEAGSAVLQQNLGSSGIEDGLLARVKKLDEENGRLDAIYWTCRGLLSLI